MRNNGYSGACSQCGEKRKMYSKTLCQRCYRYKARTGRPRPPNLRSGVFSCSNCGSSQKYAKGLCRNCYAYQRRHGENRPIDVGKIDVGRMEELLLSGYSLYAIGKETGHDWRTVRKHIQERASSRARREIDFRLAIGSKLTYDETMQIFRLRLGGMTLQAIADRFGLNQSTVSRLCKHIDLYDPTALLEDAPEPEFTHE